MPLVGRGEGALVAVVGRERGELYRLRGGRLEQLANRSEEQRRRHDQGGWSQAELPAPRSTISSRSTSSDVASELDRRARRRNRSGSSSSATEETRAVVRRPAARRAVQSAIVGWTTAEAHAGPPRSCWLRRTPILEAWRAREEQVRGGALAEGGGTQRPGRYGVGDDARSRLGRSDRPAAVPQRRSSIAAWQLPEAAGGSPSRTGRARSTERGWKQTDDGLDLAVHHTLSNGGRVWAVTTRGDFDQVEGHRRSAAGTRSTPRQRQAGRSCGPGSTLPESALPESARPGQLGGRQRHRCLVQRLRLRAARRSPRRAPRTSVR